MVDSTKKDKSELSEEGPVTVSIARKVKKGFESQYEDWERKVISAASAYPGYLGTNFLRPSAGTDYKYIIIYRFDSYQHACDWEDSEERKKWLENVKPMLEGEPVKQKQTGLEVWFELPEIEVSSPAPRYKMAIVLTVVLYILTIIVNFLFRPFTDHLSPYLGSLIILIVNVLLMTYIIMPKVTVALRKWLY